MSHIEVYNPLKDYLESEFDLYPDEQEMERIIAISVKMHSHSKNIGIREYRCKDNPREQSFRDQWLKENEPHSGINSGYGILQDLFIETANPVSALSGGKILEVITDRDRMIVATVIQWLGSNCGMGFLHESLKRFGAHIVQKQQEIPSTPQGGDNKIK